MFSVRGDARRAEGPDAIELVTDELYQMDVQHSLMTTPISFLTRCSAIVCWPFLGMLGR